MGQLKKTRNPCFSQGTMAAWWESENCGHCVKSSRMKLREKESYTRCRCAVQRDLLTQMMGRGNEEIALRSWEACQKARCPYIRNHYKPRRGSKPHGYPLFEELK